MNRYLWHYGNSNTGPIGGVVSVFAEDKKTAFDLLQEYLCTWSNVGEPFIDRTDPGAPDTAGVQYANVWINPDHITLEQGQLEEEGV